MLRIKRTQKSAGPVGTRRAAAIEASVARRRQAWTVSECVDNFAFVHISPRAAPEMTSLAALPAAHSKVSPPAPLRFAGFDEEVDEQVVHDDELATTGSPNEGQTGGSGLCPEPARPEPLATLRSSEAPTPTSPSWLIAFTPAPSQRSASAQGRPQDPPPPSPKPPVAREVEAPIATAAAAKAAQRAAVAKAALERQAAAMRAAASATAKEEAREVEPPVDPEVEALVDPEVEALVALLEPLVASSLQPPATSLPEHPVAPEVEPLVLCGRVGREAGAVYLRGLFTSDLAKTIWGQVGLTLGDAERAMATERTRRHLGDSTVVGLLKEKACKEREKEREKKDREDEKKAKKASGAKTAAVAGQLKASGAKTAAVAGQLTNVAPDPNESESKERMKQLSEANINYLGDLLGVVAVMNSHLLALRGLDAYDVGMQVVRADDAPREELHVSTVVDRSNMIEVELDCSQRRFEFDCSNADKKCAVHQRRLVEYNEWSPGSGAQAARGALVAVSATTKERDFNIEVMVHLGAANNVGELLRGADTVAGRVTLLKYLVVLIRSKKLRQNCATMTRTRPPRRLWC